MAVYFDHRAQAPYSGQNTELQWHKTFPVVAVGSQSDSGFGLCNLYLEEGDHVPDAILKKSRPPSALAWHPSKKILAVGWESGELTVWNEQDHEVYEVQPLHKTEITILQWTSNGSKLLSGDSQGQLALWRADSRGRLQQNPVSQQGLGEQLNQVVLRPPPPPDPANDIASLARAAVSGDESALDMFNWQKGKSPGTRISNPMLGPQEAICFFIGGQNGSVYYLNETGKVVQQFTAEGPIRKLLYYEEKHILVTVTTNMMLTQHAVSPEGDLREMLMVKLSGKPDHADMIWAGKGILATCTGENVIRMWDIDREENFILNLEGHSAYDRMENINCVCYSANKGVLAAGTSAGNVALFIFSPAPGAAGSKQEPEEKWKLLPPSTVPGPISDIAIGSNKNLLAVNTISEVFILTEHVMSAHCRDQTAVVQTGPMALAIEIFSSGQHQDLKSDIQIKGVSTTKESVAVFDNKKVVVYELTGDGGMIRAAGTFSCDSTLLCLYEQNVYTIEPGKIQVRTFQGTVKQLLPCTESEGEPVCMDVCSHYLVAGTAGGYIKLFDLSRREAKLHGAKNLADAMPDFGGIVSVKCNCNGSKVSVILTQPNGKANSKLYVWDVELDTVTFFNFATGRGEQDEYMQLESQSDQDLSSAEKGKNQAAKDIAGRNPLSHFWDSNEAKLCVCEAKVSAEAQQEKLEEQQKQLEQQSHLSLNKPVMEEVVDTMIVSLFITQENGVLIQDNYSMSPKVSCLLDVEVPFHYFVKRMDSNSMVDDPSEVPNFSDRPQTSVEGGQKAMVSRRVMRDFVGLESADKSARDAMMNFSYYLTIGNMDEAFKAIKLIKSESVWENMAKMCVKTRRLDVAKVCLGNMGHARGAKALREAIEKYEELDAKVAVLAMQLDLHEDAERLLKNCKRYDLLNDFYQSSGQWGKAMETAEMYDRIHLRSTYYNYAKHLETKGDINGAIPNFEKSDTHRFEVPRMLFDEPQVLEAYIMKNKDKELYRAYARMLESKKNLADACELYILANDPYSLVRMHCNLGHLEKAAEICNETGDKASCYHLARQYENNEQTRDAIHFFTRAGAYGNAIRLCRDTGNEDQMMNLALLGKPEDMVEAAKYYEFNPKHQDKAVMLYHKAGYFSKALDLAFNTKQFAALQVISEDLDESTDPELVARCADFFIENSQFDRAVDLLAVAKKYWDALKICMEQHVDMTEDLVEKLTPRKETNDNEAEERNKILEGIAEVCMQQRQYHLATKKYTQAGNKLKAMKALLKSGDTEKIVFFAGVSRQKEIYVMAANYLQSLDWRKEPEIMKNIISFYTKGRALDSLSSFYDACGQVEIDEYQNYDKALGALGEAYKCLTKAKMANQSLQEERLAELKNRIGLIKKFVQAKRVYEQDNEEAVKQCQVLLEESNIDNAVRIGDIYGLLVEHFAKKEKWKAAWNCLEEMRNRIPKLNMTYYVNIKTLEAVHRALDIPLKDVGGMNGFHMGGGEEEDGEEIDEDVVDDGY